MNNFKYYKIYKPFGMLSQFNDKEGRPVLKDLYSFPRDVYSIGRLDSDSEGLLLLTNDKKVIDKLNNPKRKVEKEYYVQVENIPGSEAILKLERGVIIEGKMTLPAKAKLIPPPDFTDRIPPVRFRKSIPTQWLSIIITEGRNRQVRKMTAAVGFPTLRLVRVRINKVLLKGMQPGEVVEMKKEDLLHILE